MIEEPEHVKMGEEEEETPRPSRNLLMRALEGSYWLLNTVSAQAVLYLIFVVLFQSLTDCLRYEPEPSPEP